MNIHDPLTKGFHNIYGLYGFPCTYWELWALTKSTNQRQATNIYIYIYIHLWPAATGGRSQIPTPHKLKKKQKNEKQKKQKKVP